jgi:hypothetical protein
MEPNFEQPTGADAGATPLPNATPPMGPGMLSERDERMWGMFCHLASLVGYIGIPLGHLVGPFIVWQVKKDQSPFVDDQGKESLNFQISMSLYLIVAGLTFCIGIGIVLLPIVYFFGWVMLIIASVKSNQGERYRYPLTIRLIK